MRANVLVAVVIALPLAGVAQDEDTADPLSEVKAPQFPAAVMLGVQPGTINRPKSWEAFETAVFSNFMNSGSSFSVPNDFALEFSPFWAGDRKVIDPKDYLTPNAGLSLRENLAFSVASTQNYELTDSVSTNAIGIGARTMLRVRSQRQDSLILARYNGAMDTADIAQALYRRADAVHEDHGCDTCTVDVYLALVKEKWITEWKEIHARGTSRAKAIESLDGIMRFIVLNAPEMSYFPDTISGLLDAYFELDARVERIASLRAEPRGLRIEVAGSFLLDFPTNAADLSYIPKAGFWITPSYQHPTWGSFEVLGVLRYLWYDAEFFQARGSSEGAFSSNLDYGARLVFKREKFSLEGEAVGRISSITLSSVTDENTGITTTQSKTESDFQYVLNLNYQLKDNIVLSYNFGRQLEVQLGASGDVISTFTLNLGFGGPVMDAGGRITK